MIESAEGDIFVLPWAMDCETHLKNCVKETPSIVARL